MSNEGLEQAKGERPSDGAGLGCSAVAMAPLTVFLSLAFLYWGIPLWIAGAFAVIGLSVTVVLFVTFLIVHHRALREHKLNTTN